MGEALDPSFFRRKIAGSNNRRTKNRGRNYDGGGGEKFLSLAGKINQRRLLKEQSQKMTEMETKTNGNQASRRVPPDHTTGEAVEHDTESAEHTASNSLAEILPGLTEADGAEPTMLNGEGLPPEQTIYPSRFAPPETYRIVKLNLPDPKIDKQFVLAVAMTGPADGRNRVAVHHKAIFHGVRGIKVRVLEEQEGIRAHDVASRKRECRDLTRRLRHADRFYTRRQQTDSPTNEGEEAEPWNWHDRLECVVLIAFSLLCIGIGIFNATNLLYSSGEATFSTWWKALPFCLTLLIGAVGLKSFARLLPPGPWQRVYGFGIFGIGLLSFLAWTICFSSVFGRMLIPIGDRLAELGSLDGQSGVASASSHASSLILLVGALADSTLCAGAWVVCTLIIQAHRIAQTIENPEWTTIRKALDRALKHLNEEQNLLGVVRGALNRERALETKFVGQAIELYEALAADERSAAARRLHIQERLLG
jgi:hypothetical protein